MTSPALDVDRIQDALHLLRRIRPDARLEAMANLCINNNGVWGVPREPRAFQPALFEAQLFGVSAMASDPARLPDNWMRAAKNMLAALPDASAA